MDKSRGELIQWVENTTTLNVAKVEQMGAGYAYCSLFNSIFGDFPMSKVKFGAKNEWEFLHNFKLLQQFFEKHTIDKLIPIDRLVKLKFQDNLEFLQWTYKFWSTHSHTPSSANRPRVEAQPEAQKKEKPSVYKQAHNNDARGANKENPALTDNTMNEMKDLLRILEEERDFYFHKLQEIEKIVFEMEEPYPDHIKSIRDVLYKVQDGFEINNEQETQTF